MPMKIPKTTPPFDLTEKSSILVCSLCGSDRVDTSAVLAGWCYKCDRDVDTVEAQFVRLDALKELATQCRKAPVYWLKSKRAVTRFIAHAEGGSHDHTCDICDEETMCSNGACAPDDRSLFLCPDCFDDDLPDSRLHQFSGREIILAATASGLPANSTRSELVVWLCENDLNGDFAQDEFTIREAWHAVGCVSGVLDE